MADQDLRILGEEKQIVRDGVRIGYRVAGDAGPVLLLFSAWQIVHSAAWRAQVPYLSDVARVITIDCRGNGRSDRPKSVEAYAPWELVADALAVLDAEGEDRAIVGGFSYGGHLAALFASRHPLRTQGAVLLAPTAPFGPGNPALRPENVTAVRDRYNGWEKYAFDYWRRDFAGFADFFMRQAFHEPHSEKQIEDACAYAGETDPETMIRSIAARRDTANQTEEAYAAIRCPVLVVNGTEDRIVPHAKGQHVARITGAEFVSLPGSGHMPSCRVPARVNRLIRDFLKTVDGDHPSPARIARRTATSRPRALFVSSPIGLGHVRRDQAIADRLRVELPGIEIEWLVQDPATRLLASCGERIHQVSEKLLNECAHVARESEGHRLNAFQALRRMDAILAANFGHFQDVVEDGSYDLVIADEAWEIDRFWHEHPDLKRGKLAWMTDFVGVLPMPEGGDAEARLVADWNTEMIGWVERNPGVRDASLFIGSPDDIVEARFGAGLPGIRPWTEDRFDFPGYVDPLESSRPGERDALRRRFGFGDDETICLVAVGGTGVGLPLLRQVMASAPHVMEGWPGLRFHLVAGPNIAADDLAHLPGVTVQPFVADFPSLAAASDMALVQGGLSSCMELASLGRPFGYIPIEGHFEQQFHVHHRLARLGLGQRLAMADLSDPDRLSEALKRLSVSAPRNIEHGGGAYRAARAIAHLI